MIPPIVCFGSGHLYHDGRRFGGFDGFGGFHFLSVVMIFVVSA